MRLAAHTRIVGALALALVAAALAPATSGAYRMTHQEYARLIAASHQGSASRASAGGSLTKQEIARLARLSREHPSAVAEAPLVRHPADRPVPQFVGVNRAKEAQEAELAAAQTRGVASGTASTPSQPVSVPGKHGLAPRYPIAATGPGIKHSTDGFDVGDAAAGAGIAAALVLLATATTLTLRRRGQLQHS
jgi:hypothetical protein